MLKRILRHRHRLVVVFVVVVVAVYAVSAAAVAETPAASPADEDSQRGFEKPRRKPAALQVPGVLRFNLLVRLPLFFLLMNLY